MDNYKYTTSEEQIKKLKSQNLLFQNEEFAKIVLDTYGYYNIINGYRDPYIIREYEKKVYCPDISFEQIFSLFQFDHALRNAILLSMIDLEEHLRALVADIISASFGSDHNTYLNNNNYRDKTVSNPRFSRNNVLAYMRQIANQSYRQPIKYYREMHGIIPPWILMKGIDFGTLINYIKYFKSPEKTKLITKIYGEQVNNQNLDNFKDLLSDTLALCREYRNLAAHGGRVYNYIPNNKLRPFNDIPIPAQGLSQLLIGLEFLSFELPGQRLELAITNSLNEHCQVYLNDIARLEQATGLNISTEKFVWINEKTHKYHINPNCSGASNLKKVTYEYASSNGFEECHKCCNNI